MRWLHHPSCRAVPAYSFVTTVNLRLHTSLSSISLTVIIYPIFISSLTTFVFVFTVFIELFTVSFTQKDNNLVQCRQRQRGDLEDQLCGVYIPVRSLWSAQCWIAFSLWCTEWRRSGMVDV